MLYLSLTYKYSRDVRALAIFCCQVDWKRMLNQSLVSCAVKYSHDIFMSQETCGIYRHNSSTFSRMPFVGNHFTIVAVKRCPPTHWQGFQVERSIFGHCSTAELPSGVVVNTPVIHEQRRKSPIGWMPRKRRRESSKDKLSLIKTMLPFTGICVVVP